MRRCLTLKKQSINNSMGLAPLMDAYAKARASGI